uniref:Uncharacterized protein n=1 Tax=Peronospora matthiolae TaxID=2874970 RepID=A0AAV1TRL1_9STRA
MLSAIAAGRELYTIGDEKKIASEAKKASLLFLASKYNVDCRCICDLVHQDNNGAFDEESLSRFRLGGDSRCVAGKELDSLLIARVREFILSPYVLIAAVIASRGADCILRKLVGENNVEPQNVINVVETAVFDDHDNESKLADRGSADLPVRSLGSKKILLLAVFAVRGDSTKLDSCILDKGNESTISH